MAEQQSDMMTEVMLEDKIADIWPEYPCLYDVRTPEFKNRDMRDKACQEMAEKLQKSSEWVKAKLKALRNSYTKAKKPSASGSSRKNRSKRASWLLEKLQFFAPHVATRPSMSNIDLLQESCPTPNSDISNDIGEKDEIDSLFDEDLNDDEITAPDETPRSTKEPLRPKTSRKRQAEEEYKIIQGLAQSITEKRQKKPKTEKPASDPMSSFCKYVAQSLSELEPQVQHLAQHKISEILFKAQTGALMQEGLYAQPMTTQTQQRYQPYTNEYSFNTPGGTWRMPVLSPILYWNDRLLKVSPN